MLTASNLDSRNTFDHPDVIKPIAIQANQANGKHYFGNFGTEIRVRSKSVIKLA